MKTEKLDSNLISAFVHSWLYIFLSVPSLCVKLPFDFACTLA